MGHRLVVQKHFLRSPPGESEVKGIRTKVDITAPGQLTKLTNAHIFKSVAVPPHAENTLAGKMAQVHLSLHSVLETYPETVTVTRLHFSDTLHIFRIPYSPGAIEQASPFAANYLCSRKNFLDIGYWPGNKEIGFPEILLRSMVDVCQNVARRSISKTAGSDARRVARAPLAFRTEQIYCDWVRRFVKFHRMRCREDVAEGTRKVEEFLTHLAVEGNVAPPTQNQALNALLFRYTQVLEQPLEGRIDAVQAREPPHAGGGSAD